MTKLSPLFRDWILVGISNATIPVIVIWKLQSGELNRTTAFVASWASFIGINLVFILASRRRDFKQGRPSRQGFILHVACLVVVMAVITTLSLYLVHSKNHYAALALSDVPLDSIEPERDRLVVELIRKRAIRSKEYAAAAAQFPPISPPLWSTCAQGASSATSSRRSTPRTSIEDARYIASSATNAARASCNSSPSLSASPRPPKTGRCPGPRGATARSTYRPATSSPGARSPRKGTDGS